MPDIPQCAACNYNRYYRTSQLTQPYGIRMQSKSPSPMCGKSPRYSYQVDVEHLRASVSQVATRWRRNAATFPCPQSHFLLPLSASLKRGLSVGRTCSMKGAGQLANVVAVKARDISDQVVLVWSSLTLAQKLQIPRLP